MQVAETPRADAIARLRDQFHGQIVLPGDVDYDRARVVWNAIADRRPAIIAGPLQAPATIASGQNRSIQHAGTFALIPAAPARGASFSGLNPTSPKFRSAR